MPFRKVPCGCDNGRVARYDEHGTESGSYTCSSCGGSGMVTEEYKESEDLGDFFGTLFRIPRNPTPSVEKETEAPDYGCCSKCGSPNSRNGGCSNPFC